jgi:CBS domain-containing protein
MPDDAELEGLRVKDLLHHVRIEPDIIHRDASTEALLQKMMANPRTRHVYVVDDEGKLCGSVRMNTVVEYLFPYTSARAASSEWLPGALAKFGRTNLSDLMNDQPRWVTAKTPLAEMAEILMREKINELPVVDEERRVVGQVSVFDVIATHLGEKRRSCE